MSLEWKTVELKSIAEITMGQSPKSEFYNKTQEGMPFLQGNKTFGDKYPSFELYTSSIKKIAEKNTVLMSVRAPVGDLNISPEDICIGRGLCSLKMKNGDNEFLYYLLKAYMPQLISKGNGTIFNSINKTDIESFKVLLPTKIEDQFKILTILKTIDDKIECCNKINKNLEEYLMHIFNDMFMEYNFNEFSTSNKEFPPSWNLGNFKDIIDSMGAGDWGKASITGNYTSEVYCIRGADIPDVKRGNKGKMPIRYILPKNFENKKLNENEIVFEISGGSPTQSTGRTVFITKEFLDRFDKDIICTNFCKVIKPKKDYEIFLYLYLNFLYDRNVMFAYENGTTGIKNFDMDNFINNFMIIIPSQDDIVNFNNLVKDFFKIIMHNGLEIEKLQNLRDMLLPQLMSGEIDISEINCDLE